MEYNPKLKMAMDEIKATIKKYDIAGVVIIHTPGYSEYLNAVSPSYSCAKINKGELVIELDVSDAGAANSIEKMRDTYNMISHLSESLQDLSIPYTDMKGFLKERFNIKDGRRSESSHESQNN